MNEIKINEILKCFYVKNASLGFEPEPCKNHTEDSDGGKTNTFESETFKHIDANVGESFYTCLLVMNLFEYSWVMFSVIL